MSSFSQVCLAAHRLCPCPRYPRQRQRNIIFSFGYHHSLCLIHATSMMRDSRPLDQRPPYLLIIALLDFACSRIPPPSPSFVHSLYFYDSPPRTQKPPPCKGHYSPRRLPFLPHRTPARAPVYRASMPILSPTSVKRHTMPIESPDEDDVFSSPVRTPFMAHHKDNNAARRRSLFDLDDEGFLLHHLHCPVQFSRRPHRQYLSVLL